MTPTEKVDRFWPAALLIVAASATIHVVLVMFTAPALLAGELIDTDSYMRLVRVRELALGDGWFDSVIDRNNWPYGDELHWTRPFDVVILVGTWLLTPFLGFERALYWAGAIVSPVMQIVASVTLAWAVMPLLRRRLLPLVMIAVLAQPAFMGYSLAGRPDHHIFLLVLVLLLLGAFARIATRLEEPEEASRWAFGAGLLGALAIWGSTELLLGLAAVLAVAGGAWVLAGGVWLGINRRISAGLLVGVIAALVVERPLSQFARVEYDRISLVHLTLGVLLWTVWLAVEWSYKKSSEHSVKLRTLLSGAGGLVTVGVMFVFFPTFFKGPMAEMDPRLFAVWYDRIIEMEPMWPADLWEIGRGIAYLGGAAFGVLASIVIVRRTEVGRAAWVLWAGLAGTYTLLALFYNLRFSSGAELLAIPLFIYWLGPAFEWIERSKSALVQTSLRAAAICALLAGPIFAGGFIMGLGKSDEPVFVGMSSCDLQDLSAWMRSDEGPGERPRTVLTFLDFGPELLYRTNHRVLAGPYHRNAAGILDIHDAFTTTDVEEREQLLAERQVDWILICPARDQGVFGQPGSLYMSLLEGPGPAISPVELPDDLAREFKLFAVQPAQLTSGL